MGWLILEGGSAPALFRSPPTTHQPKPPSQTTYQSSPLPQVQHSKPYTALAAVATRRTAATDSVIAQTWQAFPGSIGIWGRCYSERLYCIGLKTGRQTDV
ncbi:hypothetical protein J4Q44_G00056170 [Coregonus suidteri]|uniref:Uncharacterized protein n=1 Tax=Coregonus suidteri TaxID=861788 RepID=A0AAN8M234_9TELE